MTNASSDPARLKICVRGAVQGVGFRPFVFRLASELGLAGWVNNSPQGVCIEVEGPPPALEKFLLRIEADKPPRSFIQSLEASWLDPAGYRGFEIRASETAGGKTALVLPDIATCPDCLREIFDPNNRRHRYPFTNCTNCGPRFSLIEALPYDRANTSMRRFTMCPQCQAEYDDPRDRRFHAQPNACPVCGPQLELWESSAGVPPARDRRDACPTTKATGDDALLAAAGAIRAGRIVAVKGLGGFHLVADARNEDAVRRLRDRKHREEKPFALMFPSLESVQAVCEVSPLEERLLRSPEAPIVLLRRRRGASQISNLKFQIAEGVAPGNPNLGALLPSNPLHQLLLAGLGFPVVATSGNLSDEPICTEEREARERLGGIADVFLVHDRPIVRHVDDSIVRVMLDRELVLRRARGYAPLPVTLKFQVPGFRFQVQSRESEIVLAVGAHLKNSVALAIGPQVFLSQHIGDLETDQAYEAFRRVIADFERLYEARPTVIAADLHPDYLSTQYALERINRQLNAPGNHEPGASISSPSPPRSGGEGRGEEEPLAAMGQATPLPAASSRGEGDNTQRRRFVSHAGNVRHVGVQHHLAHVLSCMAENELDPPALGVSWDGTGYGPDGTVWGGEYFLITDTACERFARLRPFRLPGGDKAVKEPRRAALGLLFERFGDAAFEMKRLPPLKDLSAADLATLRNMLQRGLNSPFTSSAGRLFDAVAALIGLRGQTHFEGQTAMDLEFALEGVATEEAYELPIANCQLPIEKPEDAAADPFNRQSAIGNRQSLDWSPMIEAILADLERGVPDGLISAKFHNALAESIVAVARQAGQERVALSGGCFQNRYLTERAVRRLRAEGFRPYWHQRVPPNDGGIALGQVVAVRIGLAARRGPAFSHQPLPRGPG